MELFDGIVAKLNRADRLIDELDTVNHQYLSILTEFDAPDYWSRQVVRRVPNELAYDVTLTLPPVPLEIAARLGEILHHLRSALDHLARILVVESGNVPIDGGPNSTTFPILILPKAKGGELDIRPGTTPEIRNLLLQLQPHEDLQDRGRIHPLVLLSELNNVDKHRLLNIVTLAGGGRVTFVRPPALTSVTSNDQRQYSIKLASGVKQRIHVHADDLLDEAQIAGGWVYFLSLEGESFPRQPNLSGLMRQLHEHVLDEVVEPFARLIEK